jgi:hypothetical protein
MIIGRNYYTKTSLNVVANYNDKQTTKTQQIKVFASNFITPEPKRNIVCLNELYNFSKSWSSKN